MSEYEVDAKPKIIVKRKRKPLTCGMIALYSIVGVIACGCFAVIMLALLGPTIASIVFAPEIVYVEPDVGIHVEPIPVAYQLPVTLAQGVIFTNVSAFQVASHAVDISIEANVADVWHEMMITNHGEQAIDGVFIVPLPTEASLRSLRVTIDGEPAEITPFTIQEGRQRLQTLAHEYDDFTLLAFTDMPFVEVDVFPFTSSHTISINYQHTLDQINGLLALDIPLAFPVSMKRTIGEFSIEVQAVDALPIRNIYPATVDLAVTQADPTTFTAITSLANYQPARNLALFYAPSNAAITANVLTYRERDEEDGYFVLLAEPAPVPEDEIVPKDVMLVLDQSGSMSGVKWEQAQDAARFVLQQLNPADRFFVTTFSSSHSVYDNRLATESSADDAINWIDGRVADGGTNINDALLETLKFASVERPTTLIFMTDGQATEGETNIQNILNNLRRAVPQNVRIFVFGVGDDVNTFLLDSIAQEFRGATGYVRQNETIDAEIANLFARISSPVLTNVSLDFGDAIAGDFVPGGAVPDLYAGQNFILVGRYRAGGDGMSITLSGNANGDNQTYTFDHLTFQSERGGHDFVMRLWAARRIGEMMNIVRLGEENPEFANSIVRLSLRYGIFTSYTDFLIEQGDVFTTAGQATANTQMISNISDLQTNQTGSAAVDTADMLNRLSSSVNAAATQSYGSSYSSGSYGSFYRQQTIQITPTPLPETDMSGVRITVASLSEAMPSDTDIVEDYVLSLDARGFAQVRAFLPQDARYDDVDDLPVLISDLMNAYGIERGIEIYNEIFDLYLPLVPAADALVDGVYRIAPPPLAYRPSLQSVREKTYLLQENTYTDTTYEPDTLPLTSLAIGSQEYDELITDDPNILPYLSVGTPLIIVWDDTAYEIKDQENP